VLQAERLQALNFKANFETKLQEVRPDLCSVKGVVTLRVLSSFTCLSVASSMLKGSKSLVKLLELVLFLGNFLNGPEVLFASNADCAFSSTATRGRGPITMLSAWIR
jgi:hypothetical protein